jgi:hypothetical protein
MSRKRSLATLREIAETAGERAGKAEATTELWRKTITLIVNDNADTIGKRMDQIERLLVGQPELFVLIILETLATDFARRTGPRMPHFHAVREGVRAFADEYLDNLAELERSSDDS